MSEHKHDWIKSPRKHGRKDFFFVCCECNPDKEYQATEINGYLHVFSTDPTKNRPNNDERASEKVSARITKTDKERLKNSNLSTAKIICLGLDYFESIVVQ